jgi:hypothetical protein
VPSQQISLFEGDFGLTLNNKQPSQNGDYISSDTNGNVYLRSHIGIRSVLPAEVGGDEGEEPVYCVGGGLHLGPVLKGEDLDGVEECKPDPTGAVYKLDEDQDDD